MGTPSYRGHGNSGFRNAPKGAPDKRGQGVPYDVNGAPTGGDSTDAANLNGQPGSFYLARANHTGTQPHSTVTFAGLGNHVDDAAAAIGGVPVGGLYRNGSVLMVRVA